MQGRLEESAAHFQQVATLMPHSAEAQNNLASVLAAMGRFDEAIGRCQQALAINPDFAEAKNNLANALKQQGQLDQALALYDQALAIQPDYAEAHFDRSALKTFHSGDPELAALEALAADPARLPPEKRLYIHFALGKALDDVGQHERAIEQWLLGAALKRREISYDEAGQEKIFRLTTELIDAKLLARSGAAGDPSPLPIFIVGMPRSGTTLVEQILASHPAIYGAGELPNLARSPKGSPTRPAGRFLIRRICRPSAPSSFGSSARPTWPVCHRYRPARRG